MSRSTRAAVAVVVVIALVFGGVAAAVWFATDGAPAVEVSGTKVSREQVNDELAAVIGNEKLVRLVGRDATSTSPGTMKAELAGNLVTVIVYDLMLRRELARMGERVTAADRVAAKDLRGEAFSQSYDGFPRWLRQRLDARLATVAAMQRVVGTDDAGLRAVRRAARRADIAVDPAYGKWSPNALTVAPYPTPFTPAEG